MHQDPTSAKFAHTLPPPAAYFFTGYNGKKKARLNSKVFKLTFFGFSIAIIRN
jgi:hypothetical protein